MESNSIAAIVRALNDSGARYLVAGGLAVVAHGYVRLTMDLDLIIGLQDENLRRAMAALRDLGYRPKVPVPLEDFAISANRSRWIAEKGMIVFQVVSDRFRTVPIDIFVREPFDFDSVYARASVFEVAEQVGVRVVPLPELLVMKETANRPKDQIDLLYLRRLAEDARES